MLNLFIGGKLSRFRATSNGANLPLAHKEMRHDHRVSSRARHAVYERPGGS